MENNPLGLWRKVAENGHVGIVTDEEIESSAIEVAGMNTRSTYISCPLEPEKSLGIRLPVLNLLLKTTGEEFSFTTTVIDDKGIHLQVCVSNWQAAKHKKGLCVVQLRPSASWEHFKINLADVTKRVFGTSYVETVKVQIHASCRIRRMFFSDRLYSREELPPDYQVTVSGEGPAAPSVDAGAAGASSVPPPEAEHQGHRTGPNDRLTTFPGHDFIRGFHTILYGIGWSPLKSWKKEVKCGHVDRVMDDEIKSSAIEVYGINMQSTHITCPPDPRDKLGIRLPFLNLLLKKTGQDLSFEITVTDEKSFRRQIILTTFRKEMKTMVYVACVPLTLSASWEHFIINLAYVTKMAFGTKYKETVKIQIHANCRIRRVYFSHRVYSYKELPNEYKLRIVGEGHTAPGVKAAMVDTLPAVPSGSDHHGLKQLRIATGLPTTAAGPVYARGIQSMLNSTEKDPLNRWEKEVENGHVKCVMDKEINYSAIEVQGRNLQTTYITCPSGSGLKLGVRQPFLNLLLKNTGDDLGFEITVIDDEEIQRRVKLTTLRKEMIKMEFVAWVPLALSTSWELIIVNLVDVTRIVFGTKYKETVKMQIHANCHIRSVYFSDRVYTYQELPKAFKVNISGENQSSPSMNIVMVDRSSVVPPGSRPQVHGLNKSRKGSGRRSTRSVLSTPSSLNKHPRSPGRPVERFNDEETKCSTPEVHRTNRQSTDITCPQGSKDKLDPTPAAGFHTILDSVENDPLHLWKKEVASGHVTCVTDEEIKSSAIEVCGTNIESTSISWPSDPENSLGISLPFLNLLLKKTGEDLSFEITIIDDTNLRRHMFLGSRGDRNPVPLSFHWPLSVSNNWQYFCLNLADVTNRVFSTKYVETVKIQIHANCRVRRVYFTDRLCSYRDLPSDYQVNISTEG